MTRKTRVRTKMTRKRMMIDLYMTCIALITCIGTAIESVEESQFLVSWGDTPIHPLLYLELFALAPGKQFGGPVAAILT